MYCYNKRSAYSDNEIAKLIRDKMEDNNHTAADLVDMYKIKYKDLNEQIIQYMCSGTVTYNLDMYEIAADYLNISFEELTSIIEDTDELSYRKYSDETYNEFTEILNYLFSEMIRQEKLSQ